MENTSEGIRFLREYRADPEKYLPLSSYQYKHFDEWDDEITRNMCWGAGILEDNRPYFMECWKVFLTTSVTVRISAKGIEHWQDELQFLLLLVRAGLITGLDREHLSMHVLKQTEEDGNEFFAVNLVLSVDEKGQFVQWGGETDSFEALNRLNDETAGGR